MTVQQQNERIRLTMFKLLCSGMGIGALVWAILCMWFNMYRCALIPLGYLLITVLNLVFCRSNGQVGWCMRVQVFFSLILPFLFQATLGGGAPSGLVMIWSFVALGGALTFQRRMVSIGWVVLEVAIVIVFAIYNPVIDLGDPLSPVSLSTQNRFLAFNLASVTVLIFTLAIEFVRVQGRMRRKIHEVRQELESANQLLMDQRSETMKALGYARQIQQALLPDLRSQKALFSAVHVLDRPRDMVGGDSFWCGGHGDHQYLVVIDCTGHGMPGALLSMLCHGIFNELVYKDHVGSGSELIRRAQTALDQLLHRNRSGTKDDAEIAVLHFDHRRQRVTFSGLGCSLIHTKKGHIEIHRGQRSLQSMMERWDRLEEIPLVISNSSRLFMYTDGVVDQFNAAGKTKFSTKRLIEFLKGQGDLSFAAARNGLVAALDDWRKDGDQTDDMLLVALEPSASWHGAVEDAEAA